MKTHKSSMPQFFPSSFGVVLIPWSRNNKEIPGTARKMPNISETKIHTWNEI